jgi:hypothetical protein
MKITAIDQLNIVNLAESALPAAVFPARAQGKQAQKGRRDYCLHLRSLDMPYPPAS